MNNINKLIAYGAIAAFALTGCGASGGSSAPGPSTQAALNSNVLQVAAGTVNLFGAANGGLNIVATYRQPAGATLPGGSATLLNSPTLTLPAAIPAGFVTANAAGYDPCSTAMFGAGTNEGGTTAAGATSQTPGTSCATTVTTFGQSGGVYGSGIEPYNSVGQGQYAAAVGIFGPSSDGSPYQVPPYPVPLYDPLNAPTGNTDPNLFIPWGGPPAFSLNSSNGDSVVGNGLYPTGTKGQPLGLDVFAGIAAVAGGKYTLSVTVPANTGAVTQSASFTLAALTNLPTPANPAYVPDGNGGGTFAFVMPAGATDALLQITDFGPDNATAPKTVSCNGSGTGDTIKTTGNGTGNAIYYTIHATASGTLTLPDTIGPGGAPSVCTAAQNGAANTPGGNGTGVADADQIAIQVIAADYNLFGIQYPQSAGVTAPTLPGANASADLALSAATCQQAAGACVNALPLLKGRSYGRTTTATRKH